MRPGYLFLGFALLPALHVKEITFTALPGEFLVANNHVVGQRSIETVGMFVKDGRVQDGKNANGDSNRKGNVNPSPHFVHLFFGSVVAGHEFLLVSHTSPNLFHGLGLHGGFGTNLGDSLRRAALDQRQGLTSGEARSNTERLQLM